MGTNFYLKCIPTEDDWQWMESVMQNRDIDKLRNIANRFDEKIHIGKRSCGWKFSFRANDNLYKRSFDDVFKFLWYAVYSDSYEFVDEYGTVYGPDEFDKWMNEVKESYIEHDDYPAYDSKKYSERNPSEAYVDRNESFGEDGSRWIDCDFC